LNYIGNQGHRLITSIEANPGDPSLCLLLSDPANVTNGTTCGPFGQNTVYSVAPGVPLPPTVFFVPGTTNQITGTRTVLNPAFFGSNPYMKEIANSAFNSFQASVKLTSSRAEFLVGYTLGKCLDNSSGLQDSTNPFDPRLSRSLCAFDVAQNFVASYSVQLGLDRLFHADHGFGNKLASGWELSGITNFVTGLPITLSENDDLSLIGVTTAPVDVPQVTGTGTVFAGGSTSSRNPRTGLPYFNGCIASTPGGTSCPSSSSAAFDFETLGQIGNANRRFFHGPGINNWDVALLKNTRFKETMNLQLLQRVQSRPVPESERLDQLWCTSPHQRRKYRRPVRGRDHRARSTNPSTCGKIFLLVLLRLPVARASALIRFGLNCPLGTSHSSSGSPGGQK
jgi:hypothetical protein